MSPEQRGREFPVEKWLESGWAERKVPAPETTHERPLQRHADARDISARREPILFPLGSALARPDENESPPRRKEPSTLLSFVRRSLRRLADRHRLRANGGACGLPRAGRQGHSLR